jgi:endonuclease/exonuclease/phosphatase (EEP) superfamily protein YafD
VLAGDLNTTQFRPEYRKLLRRGVVDAHDSLGKGLTTSFRLAANGVLSSPGSIVRLDHALLSDGVAAMEVEDLDPCGSDHQPFRLVAAVRQHAQHRHHFRHRHQADATEPTAAPSPPLPSNR